MLARIGMGLAALAIIAAPAAALPLEATAPGEPSLWEIYNDIYGGPIFADHADFIANANLIDPAVFFSTIMENVGTVTAQAHYAGFRHTFGLYQVDGDGNIINEIELFSNISTFGPLVGPEFTASFNVSGDIAGFYNTIRRQSGTVLATWYSDDALNFWNSNPDSPHMLIYEGQLPNQYVIAWEDTPLTMSDRDYNDLVLTITLGPQDIIPEPATMLLLGMGLAGVAAGRLRRKA